MYVTKKYLNGAYKSCSKVYVPSMGKLALDLICGDLDTSRCSPMKWFHFMGDAANIPYVPFQITYIPTDVAIKGYEPIDPYVTPCSHPLNVSISRDCFAIRDAKHSHKLIMFSVQPKTPACGCVDSEESCPVPPALSSPPQPFTLNGYDGYAVIMTVIFVSGSTLFFHLIYSFSDIKRIGKTIGNFTLLALLSSADIYANWTRNPVKLLSRKSVNERGGGSRFFGERTRREFNGNFYHT